MKRILSALSIAALLATGFAGVAQAEGMHSNMKRQARMGHMLGHPMGRHMMHRRMMRHHMLRHHMMRHHMHRM